MQGSPVNAQEAFQMDQIKDEIVAQLAEDRAANAREHATLRGLVRDMAVDGKQTRRDLTALKSEVADLGGEFDELQLERAKESGEAKVREEHAGRWKGWQVAVLSSGLATLGLAAIYAILEAAHG